MKKTLTILVLEIVLLGVWYAVAGPPRVVVKRAVTPEPHSIAELRKVDKVKPFPACDFASVEVGSVATRVTGLTGDFSVSLPGNWTKGPPDTITHVMHDRETAFLSDRGARISIVHAPSSNGRTLEYDPKTMQPLPGKECESVVDSAGAIWRLYPAYTLPDGRARFTANGDAVTTRYQRYKFFVGSWSEGERDSLAATLSAAVTKH